MKLRNLMLCLLACVLVSGTVGIHTYAAEVTEQITETTATDVITQASDTNLIETEDTTQTIETSKESEVTEPVEELTDSEGKEEESSDSALKETKVKKETTTKASTTKASTEKKAKKTEQVTYTKAELRLLAALISCEANGEPYAGKVAVGIVVVNRMESKSFPNTIKSVIYQKYQFGPARNGALAKALNEYDDGKFTSKNEKACIKAAKEALSGTKQTTYKDKKINMKSYLYFSGRVRKARLTIANHQFK
ncbi:MAG: cell wall hydrolase [Velocimicrobium sp.]